MPSMSKQQYTKFTSEFLHQWEEKLSTYNAFVLARQIREWQRVSTVFDNLIKELSEKNTLSPNQIFKLEEYKRFLEESRKIMSSYARFNVALTTVAQTDFANSALTVSNTLLNIIDTNWSRLPVEAVNKMIGRTADGSPLYSVFNERFGENVDKATGALVEGIARGLNPNQIAKNMRDKLDISIYDSSRITRTEALNVYRDVSYSSYVESGIVTAWDWIAESDACSECLQIESNNPYSLDRQPDSPHPFCRCAIAPHI